MDSHVTTGGCRLRVSPAPDHLGEGVMLNLSMESPLDTRTAEVFLDPESRRWLNRTLVKEADAPLPQVIGRTVKASGKTVTQYPEIGQQIMKHAIEEAEEDARRWGVEDAQIMVMVMAEYIRFPEEDEEDD